jgi:hypothetical protein
MSTRKIIRTSQPQGAVGIDLSSQFSNGMAHLISGGGGPLDLVRNRPFPPTYGSVGPLGKSFKNTSNANLGVEVASIHSVSTSNGNGTGDFSLLVYTSPTSSTSPLVAVCTTAGNLDGFTLGFNFGTSFGVSAGSFTLANTNGATSVIATSALDGNPHVWVAVRRGSTAYLYRDGVLLTSGTFATGIKDVSNQSLYIAGYSGGGGGYTDHLYLVACANVAWSESALKQLGSNPWQLFTPRKSPIWTPYP